MGKLVDEIEGNYEITNGDCLEELKRFENSQFQVCITSPPY
jgi:DNA modification methylase